jgi:hypothetical protein
VSRIRIRIRRLKSFLLFFSPHRSTLIIALAGMMRVVLCLLSLGSGAALRSGSWWGDYSMVSQPQTDVDLVLPTIPHVLLLVLNR